MIDPGDEGPEPMDLLLNDLLRGSHGDGLTLSARVCGLYAEHFAPFGDKSQGAGDWARPILGPAPKSLGPAKPSGDQSQEAMQDDIADLLDALRLVTHARPISPHEVMQEVVIPHVQCIMAGGGYAADPSGEQGREQEAMERDHQAMEKMTKEHGTVTYFPNIRKWTYFDGESDPMGRADTPTAAILASQKGVE